MSHDISQSVSQRGNGAYDEENRRIQEVSDELQRLCRLYDEESRDGKSNGGRFSEVTRTRFLSHSGFISVPGKCHTCQIMPLKCLMSNAKNYAPPFTHKGRSVKLLMRKIRNLPGNACYLTTITYRLDGKVNPPTLSESFDNDFVEVPMSHQDERCRYAHTIVRYAFQQEFVSAVVVEVGYLQSLTHTHDETRQACLHSKVVKIDHFEIRHVIGTWYILTGGLSPYSTEQ